MPRQLCPECQRPELVCVCGDISPQYNLTPVIILRHPDEAVHPLNTAGLACRGVENAKLFTGLDWPREQLALHVPASWLARPVLLYPGKLARAACEQGAGCSAWIALDGTWRNTRELMLRNPWLNSLPRVQIEAAPASVYRIRKAPQPGALSTIEALGMALQAGQDGFDLAQYLKPFIAMVDRHISLMGEKTFKRNYACTLEKPSF